jgi:hypothetical protein
MRYLKHYIIILFILTFMPVVVQAQAGRAVNQNDTVVIDIAEKNDTFTVSQVWKRALIMPGYGQIFNKQYWKAPIVWTGMVGLLYRAYQSNLNMKNISAEQNSLTSAGFSRDLAWDEYYQQFRMSRNIYLVGAGAVYLWSLLDGTKYYPFDKGEHLPGRATIYSTLLPGLGQMYNRKYWKLPIVYGGFLTFAYLIQSRNFRYKLYGREYNILYEMNLINKELPTLGAETPEYAAAEDRLAFLESQKEPRFAMMELEQLKSYRDKYRRDRDSYIIYTVLFYFINIIDATVDAHFMSYDVGNDLTFSISPMIFMDTPDARRVANSSGVTAGLSLNFKF